MNNSCEMTKQRQNYEEKKIEEKIFHSLQGKWLAETWYTLSATFSYFIDFEAHQKLYKFYGIAKNSFL